MARPEKVQKVESLTKVFNEARSVVLNDFTGLNVEMISELRRMCRRNNVEFLVVKNTLAKRGIKGTPAEELDSFFEGPTALAISRESENESARVLAEFVKENEIETPKFKAAIVEGRVIDATEVLRLAKLPSREVLLSQLLAGLKGPAQGLVSVLQGTARNLVYVLNAIAEQKEADAPAKEEQKAGAEAEAKAEPEIKEEANAEAEAAPAPEEKDTDSGDGAPKTPASE